MKKISGIIAGYDPGGNDTHGLALLRIKNSKPESISTTTLSYPETVLNEIKTHNIIGIGVDTLSCWCTADLWLRRKYPEIIHSIMPPNTLAGSMGINGMAVLIEVSKNSPEIILSETHPKVLYYALSNQIYNYYNNNKEMDNFLSRILGIADIKTANEHEWDAAISAYALLMGMTGGWKIDLHELPLGEKCRIVRPCGKTFYYWRTN